jgi:integrase
MQQLLADWQADRSWRPMRKRHQATLHLLSVREVQTFGEGDHGDGGGLILRIRGASANFVFRFTAPSGKRREMGLGPAHRNNAAQAGQCLTAARETASDARSLLQRGMDPIDERARTRDEARARAGEAKAQQQRQQLTLARAARGYHERVIEPRMSAKHAAQWISSLENHIPPEIWSKVIGDIDAPELLLALAGVRSLECKGEHVPETLSRIRQRLDSVFEDAIFHGHCTTNPAAAIRRKIREQLPKRKAGKFRALDYREAPAFMEKLRAAHGVSPRCLEFALLTAARTGEALAAEWSEFDLDAGVWTVPAAKMKGDEEHIVHLSKRARELVAGQLGQDKVYLFPSYVKPGQRMSNMSLLATLGRMGMRGDTTVHGVCRATFSTWANETAAARPEVIEACLAHKESDLVKAAYNRAQFTEERRALMEAWAAYLDKPRAASKAPLRIA